MCSPATWSAADCSWALLANAQSCSSCWIPRVVARSPVDASTRLLLGAAGDWHFTQTGVAACVHTCHLVSCMLLLGAAGGRPVLDNTALTMPAVAACVHTSHLVGRTLPTSWALLKVGSPYKQLWQLGCTPATWPAACCSWALLDIGGPHEQLWYTRVHTCHLVSCTLLLRTAAGRHCTSSCGVVGVHTCHLGSCMLLLALLEIVLQSHEQLWSVCVHTCHLVSCMLLLSAARGRPILQQLLNLPGGGQVARGCEGFAHAVHRGRASICGHGGRENSTKTTAGCLTQKVQALLLLKSTSTEAHRMCKRYRDFIALDPAFAALNLQTVPGSPSIRFDATAKPAKRRKHVSKQPHRHPQQTLGCQEAADGAHQPRAGFSSAVDTDAQDHDVIRQQQTAYASLRASRDDSVVQQMLCSLCPADPALQRLCSPGTRPPAGTFTHSVHHNSETG